MLQDLRLHTMQRNLGLPPIDQLGFVVQDMDRALEEYGALFGDFHVLTITLTGTKHRGREVSPTIRNAFGRSGSLEIELIQPAGGDGPHSEFLDRHGEGLHHVRFVTPDHDKAVKRVSEAGWTPVSWVYVGEYTAVYCDPPGGRTGTMIELINRATAPFPR